LAIQVTGARRKKEKEAIQVVVGQRLLLKPHSLAVDAFKAKLAG